MRSNDIWYSQAGRPWGSQLSFYVDTWTHGVVGESPWSGRRSGDIERPPVRPKRGEWTDIQVTEPWYWEDGMSRLFGMSHREVFDLMCGWGFVPERINGGHQIMRDPETGIRVQIMPPGRAGTGEKGNAIGMKKAASIRGVSVQTFLDGPPSPNKEVEMAPGRPMSEVGLAADMRRWIEAHKDQPIDPKEMHADLLTAHPNLKLGIVQSMLAQWASPKRINQPVLRQGKKYRFASKEEKAKALADHQARVDAEYAQLQERIAAKQAEAAVSSPPESSVTDETPDLGEQIEAGETEVRGPIVGWAPMKSVEPKAIPANGSTPDLLSKVAKLDGNKYLFQGDDGALYVLKDVVRLEV